MSAYKSLLLVMTLRGAALTSQLVIGRVVDVEAASAIEFNAQCALCAAPSLLRADELRDCAEVHTATPGCIVVNGYDGAHYLISARLRTADILAD